MKRIFFFVVFLIVVVVEIFVCINLIVGKNVFIDGLIIVFYLVDLYGFFGELYYYLVVIYFKGIMMDIYEWDIGKYLGQIEQVCQIYNVIGNMNEFQVIIGEMIFGGCFELVDMLGIIDYGSLIYVGL